MLYSKTQSNAYYVGLPDVPTLDDEKLTDEQKELLAKAVEAGIYTPIVEKSKEREYKKVAMAGDLQKD